MIHTVGYSVSYRRDAFRTSVEPDGIRLDKLEETLEGLAQSIRRVSRGHWIVIPQNGFLSNEADASIDLVVFVPAGDDQYEQLLAAVNQLEEGFNSYLLTLPIDKSLRTIEGHSLPCVRCGEKPRWRYPSSDGIDDYFCDLHVKIDPRFAKLGLIRAEEATITI
jgi:hypothetical protein